MSLILNISRDVLAQDVLVNIGFSCALLVSIVFVVCISILRGYGTFPMYHYHNKIYVNTTE